MGNPRSVTQSDERLSGLLAATTGTNANVRVVPVDSLTVEEGRRAGGLILQLPVRDRPDGLFAANDMVAIGAMTVLLQAGVLVPEDVSIVGFDDVDYARKTIVPLTTIRQPGYDIGRAAAQQLLQQLSTPDAPIQPLLLPATLVVRDSSTPGQASAAATLPAIDREAS